MTVQDTEVSPKSFQVPTNQDKPNGLDHRDTSPVCHELAGNPGQMDDPMATLNDNGQVERLSMTAPGKAPVAQPNRNESRRGSVMRFTYPSGAKPLEGYTIKRGIGIGGFGEVYFSVSDAGKEVALKRIQRNVDVELRGVSQCLNLKHSNLITLWDIRQDDHGEGWVVMEYVPGPNLRDLIEDYPDGLPEVDALRWFKAMCRGVAYLHDHGIVHRDLKPGNVFFDDGEQVLKIGDYGLSKFISCSRRSGQTESVGTFHYMAPEIGKGVYGKEIDIYALGIILFEMLTGRVPFDGESSQEIIMKHLTADPNVDGVGAKYQRIIRRSMAKDPDRRYRNVHEMLEALDAGSPEDRGNSSGGHRRSGSSDGEIVNAVESSHPQSSQTRGPQVGPMFINDEPFFIGEDAEEIVMGDVQHVVLGEPIPTAPDDGPKQAAPQTQTRTPSPTNRQQPRPNASTRASGNASIHTSAEATDTSTIEEPIARSLLGGWNRVVQNWNDSNMGTPVKVLLLVLIGFALLINVHWLLPLCAVIGILYSLYYFIRSLVIWRKKTALANSEVALVDSRKVKREQAEAKERILRKALDRKPGAERIMELTGSMLMSSVVVATLGLLSMAIAGDSLSPTVESMSFYAWLTLTGVFASWTLLAASKFWDGTRGDALKRRFILLAGGLTVGAASYATSEILMVKMPTVTTSASFAADLSTGFHDKSGTPMLPAYLLYFAGLFFVLRWWRNADPLRKTRLSVIAVGFCLLWACLLNQLCQFPLPWGILLAGTISFAVQIASPYLDKEDRRRIETELQQAQG